jgi:hypothetical protein
MSVDWIAARLYFEERYGVSTSGESRSIGWFVPDLGPKPASEEPGAPQKLDQHPDNPSLVAESVSYLPNAAGTIVRANYVEPEYLPGGPAINTDGADFSDIDVTTEYIDALIPVFRKVATTIDGTAKNLYKAVDKVVPFRYSRSVYRVTLNFNAQLIGSPIGNLMAVGDLIARQNNKIHSIPYTGGGTKKLLFESKGTKPISATKYQATYKWSEDPGIPNTYVGGEYIGASEGSGRLREVGAELVAMSGNADFIRRPFMRLETAVASLDGTEDPTKIPAVFEVEEFEEEPNGWLQLPGVTT